MVAFANDVATASLAPTAIKVRRAIVRARSIVNRIDFLTRDKTCRRYTIEKACSVWLHVKSVLCIAPTADLKAY